MDKRDLIIAKLKEQRLMPLFFHADAKVCMDTMEALYHSGVRLIEYTNRGAEALQNFSAMKEVAEKKYTDLYVGAGTIKDAHQAELFIKAGADFLISPAVAEDVYDIAYNNKILWIPGCMTPTEILKAEQFGLALVKLFPGNVLGPGYVQAINDLFPSMNFMPTGGVDTTIENLKEWFDAGVCAVGMGSKLISKSILQQKDYAGITKLAAEILGKIKSLHN
ncbi:MAG: bifunctional 4-hydroxy-2-oxoglutarate aldolase/2-dehydro-3-deoxy-phosphogluconate aldolase [Bacteroidetes bacterium]|nr:bifunctional 4-hydroxy-2-oxoglutarate aldolase/2-dehydro-3-deoxy-phosphogluconate aldolase [Bacteroidota bacterium]MBS1758002.1 bifunctional 4-hydroxy-2-oxoglutarate aldolase/2-dehydro-3-deoxy-phosphogluconate aldolase [Bacteroidota bacterium]